MDKKEEESSARKKVSIKLPRINIKNFPSWWKQLIAGWVEYFVSLPERAKSLTRREIRVKIARYLFAVVMTYFVVGVVVGVGFYVKRIPLSSNFGWFCANIYPFPAEVVGARAVTLKDVADQEKIIYFFASASNSSLGDRLEVDQKVMDSVEEVRLAQNALSKYGVKVTQGDIDEVMSQIEEENGGKEQVSQLLQTLYGLTTPQFRGVIYDQIARDKVQSEVLKTIKVRHILVDDEGQANEIRDKIKNSEITFAEAVTQYSKDTQANENGGLIQSTAGSDFIGRDSGLAKEFLDAAYDLTQGKVSAPIKTEFGWHLIVVEEIKGKVDMSYSDWLQDARDNTFIWKLYRP